MSECEKSCSIKVFGSQSAFQFKVLKLNKHYSEALYIVKNETDIKYSCREKA